MNPINQDKTKLILLNLKVEIDNFKKTQAHAKSLFYPKHIKNHILDLLHVGVSPAFISKTTEIAINTVYGWKNKSKGKKKTSIKGFKKLAIINEVKTSPLKSDGQILISLSEEIKLSVPLDLMGSMIQILKEQWHVSRK